MILSRKELYGKSGIYKIFTSVNSRIYIGSSSNLYTRISLHFERLKKLTHENIILLNHAKKYGYEVFDYEIVEFCDVPDLIVREQYYLDFFKSYNKGFNILHFADAPRGHKQSEETIRKRSQKLKGRKLSKEHCEKISKANTGKPSWAKGKKFSIEHCKKIGLAHKNEIHSEESKIQASRDRLGKYVGSKHPKARIILQFDKNNTFIKEWSCPQEVQRELGLKQSNIIKVCREQRPFCGGFVWRYKFNTIEEQHKETNWKLILE